jgi:hypothetical protein|tara:strand:+ start:618 stop:1991 length:1374 start_codon:yes stop_codon:yes gene_type:complete
MAQFWYDQQIRRYLLQFVRIFNGFQVKSGQKNAGGTSSEVYKTVPMRYADMSRLVAHVLRGNTENAINSTPFMTCNIANLNVARERRHDPKLVSAQQVQERKYDSMNDQYTAELGNTYTVERYMPVPYDLTINVDVWCSNTEQKLQLLEQVLTLFNPTVELQANTNPLDWTNITVVELIDIQWSSRSVPQGVDTQLDIATLIFQVPIWINPPAKVKKQTIINQIINRIHLDESMDDLVYDKNMADFFDQFGTLEEIVITPQDAQVSVQGNTVSLLSSTGVNENYAWKEFFEQYGEFQAGTSKLKLRRSSDLEDSTQDIVGTIAYNPTNDNQLIFTIDSATLPTNTQTAVLKIIDPAKNHPGDGTLANQATGQRYLLVSDIPGGTANWGNVSASANDILQFNGTQWEVSLDVSVNESTVQYVTNTATGYQYKWTGTEWIDTYQGQYKPGYWILNLTGI